MSIIKINREELPKIPKIKYIDGNKKRLFEKQESHRLALYYLRRYTKNGKTNSESGSMASQKS